MKLKQLLHPFYTMIHPFKGFDDIKWEQKGHLWVPAVIAGVWLLLSVFSHFFTGFTFNYGRPEDFNLLIEIVRTVGLLALWITANWCVCTIMDGSGKLREIIICSAYSMVPYIISVLISIAASNWITESEAVFVGMITAVCMLWSFLLLFVAMQMIHEYQGLRALWSMLLTVAAMAVIIFLALLFFTLFKQLYTFIVTIFSELSMRS